MIKTIYYGAIDTYSGYGAASRDRVKALIELYKDKWNIQIISCNWGGTPKGFIKDNYEEWGFLEKYIVPGGQIQYQPDIMIWHTIASEAKPLGKFNILMTAGIETTVASSEFIEGCNRMDLNIVPSTHVKKVFQNTKFEKKNKSNNATEGFLKLEKPIEVIFEGVKEDIYKCLEKNEFINKELYETINSIPEQFTYLYTGMWTQGIMGEDRKNVSLLIKAFLETFKNTKNPPALVLKTTMMGSSYIDKEEITKRIKEIKKTVNCKTYPNIYLLHGEFTDTEMNEIYNNPKIKAMVSLTKGEGFGRPLLEFTLSKKPIICSGWSGQTDFLKPEYSSMIGGQLTKVHPSAANSWLLEDSEWFSPDHGQIGFFLKDVFENYKKYIPKGKQQGFYSKTNFNYNKMKENLKELLDKSIPEFPTELTLKLPTFDKITLPTLKQITNNGTK